LIDNEFKGDLKDNVYHEKILTSSTGTIKRLTNASEGKNYKINKQLVNKGCVDKLLDIVE
jgi:hypothetical protein